jgi:hypothetical protein
VGDLINLSSSELWNKFFDILKGLEKEIEAAEATPEEERQARVQSTEEQIKAAMIRLYNDPTNGVNPQSHSQQLPSTAQEELKTIFHRFVRRQVNWDILQFVAAARNIKSQIRLKTTPVNGKMVTEKELFWSLTFKDLWHFMWDVLPNNKVKLWSYSSICKPAIGSDDYPLWHFYELLQGENGLVQDKDENGCDSTFGWWEIQRFKQEDKEQKTLKMLTHFGTVLDFKDHPFWPFSMDTTSWIWVSVGVLRVHTPAAVESNLHAVWRRPFSNCCPDLLSSAWRRNTTAGKSTFQTMDEDNDGKLSSHEVRKGGIMGVHAFGLDYNRDGEITQLEFEDVTAAMSATGGTIIEPNLAAQLDKIAAELKQLKFKSSGQLQETSFNDC